MSTDAPERTAAANPPAPAAGAEVVEAPALPWKVRALIVLGTGLLRMLARTWRIREDGRQGFRALHARGEGVVIVLWHGQMLPLLVHQRDEGVAILISEHRDGEIIARIAHAFGCRTVRGSSSRGGARALLQMTGVLRTGGDIAVTPDGPRGPRHTFAPGALVAANRANAHVVPVVAHVASRWQLGSWDRFEIPKPFARIGLAYGEPMLVPGASAREAAESAPRFAEVMASLAARAAVVAAG